MHPQLLFQNGRQQSHPVVVQPQDSPARRSETGCGRQGLKLHQDGPRTLHAGRHHRAGRVVRHFRKKHGRRVRDLVQPLFLHLEHPDFVGGAEPVLHGAQYSKYMVAIPLEVQDRVHHVLQKPGARDGALLGDVSHQKRGNVALLGRQHQAHGRLAHLAHRPGRRGQVRVEHGLDRIDHQHMRLQGLQHLENGLQLHLRNHVQLRRDGLQSLASQADLIDRLLAGNVQDPVSRSRQPMQGLEHQRGFSDPRVPADQNHRPRHQTAAQHPVELVDAGGQAAIVVQLDGIDGHGIVSQNRALARPDGPNLRLFLHERVPLAAIRAFAHPLGRLMPAFLAHEYGFRAFLHKTPVSFEEPSNPITTYSLPNLKVPKIPLHISRRKALSKRGVQCSSSNCD